MFSTPSQASVDRPPARWLIWTVVVVLREWRRGGASTVGKSFPSAMRIRLQAQETSVSRRYIVLLVLCGLPGLANAAPDRFFGYNQTTATVFTGVFLAPEGTDEWGPNEALNDKDKTWEA